MKVQVNLNLSEDLAITYTEAEANGFKLKEFIMEHLRDFLINPGLVRCDQCGDFCREIELQSKDGKKFCSPFCLKEGSGEIVFSKIKMKVE